MHGTPEQQIQIDAVCARLYQVSDRVAARFVAEFERLKAMGSPDAYDNRLGFADGNGKVDIARAAIKYVLKGREQTAQKLPFLPHFKGVKSALDIGVGPAQLFMLLQDGYGIRMRGIDKTDSQGEFLYRALWEEYGIRSKMTLCEVRAGVAFPIPEDTDAVLAFWPTFDNGWTEYEHAWFIAFCRSRGARRIYWKFNSHTLRELVITFYQGRGARFPVLRDMGFCVLDL